MADEGLIEAMARGVCSSRCLLSEKQDRPCIDPVTHANAPCAASVNQLVLCGKFAAARAALTALREAGYDLVKNQPRANEP